MFPCCSCGSNSEFASGSVLQEGTRDLVKCNAPQGPCRTQYNSQVDGNPVYHCQLVRPCWCGYVELDLDDSNFSVRFPSENIFHVCYWIQFPLIGCSMNHFFVTILLLLASIMSSVHTSYRESSWRTCSVWRHIRTASSANILFGFSNFKKHASFSIMSINCVHQISPCAGLRRLILIHQSLWRRG